MSKIRIKQVRSVIGRPKKQKDTIKALGFKRNQQIIEKESNPQVLGMIKKVSHLIEVLD